MSTFYAYKKQGNSMNLHIDTEILIAESSDKYHSMAKYNLSSHQLLDFMKCPLYYHKKKCGMIKDVKSSSFLLGSAAHTRILEGKDVYHDSYDLRWPCDPKTGSPLDGRTKAVKQWKGSLSKEAIHPRDILTIEMMAQGVSVNNEAVELLSYGVAEGVVREHYCELVSQIRIDWLNPRRGIVDLKTCSDLSFFESDCRKYGYANQLAFYQAVLKEKIGEYVPVHIIAIEKNEPYRCGLWRLSDELLVLAREQNEAAIESLKVCQNSGLWPTGFEQMRVLEAF
jgi:hypothetical protein